MPPKKGLATTKKVGKYVYIHEDTGSVSAAVKQPGFTRNGALLEVNNPAATSSNISSAFLDNWDRANDSLNDLRGIPKRSNSIEPCQDTQSFGPVELRQTAFTKSISPPAQDEQSLSRIKAVGSVTPTKSPRLLQRTDTPREDALRRRTPPDDHKAPSEQKPAYAPKSRGSELRFEALKSITSDSTEQLHTPSDPPVYQLSASMTTMIPGGAFVPPNQQRNLRACMVCSVVRTYTQFMNGGCPNCEEILELAGNSENVNDCTSQVFEGLITVADTSKSWVARYQRLEGYVAGVYATQVEGILPEEIISAIEAAGINYVPRDGSEDQMIPKD